MPNSPQISLTRSRHRPARLTDLAQAEVGGFIGRLQASAAVSQDEGICVATTSQP